MFIIGYSFSVSSFNKIHTVGPANKEVPESAIAEQPSEQNPENEKHVSVRSTTSTGLLKSYRHKCTHDEHHLASEHKIGSTRLPVDSPPTSTSPMSN